MRIGVNCFMLRPNIGGMKQYFFNLFRELLESDDGNDYVFFYFPHNLGELSELGTDRWRSSAIELTDQNQVKDHLERIDLYFCPFGALWPRPLPLPTVLTLVDIQEAFYPEFFTELDKYNRAYHFHGSTRMADRVVTISRFSKEAIVRHHGIPLEKVVVAYLCPDARFHRAREIMRRPSGPLPRGEFILFPANRWQHKNHDGLLRALEWLRDQRNLEIDAVFTGYDVPNGYPLPEKAREYGLERQIYSLGYVTVEELAFLYSHARMLVFPSFFEGFGIPLVEAMAAGCPVAAANATSLPEIACDAARYFDPHSPESIGSVVEELWKDASLRSEGVERGYRRAQHFSPSTLGQVHRTAFKEATQAFSKLRYSWNFWVYRHFHHAYVHWKYRRVLWKR